MAIDNIGVIETEGARVVAALEPNRDARIPWSDKWTVATCAQHVGGAHHVVAQVVNGRPTADFGLFSSLAIPERENPELAGWIAEGTAAVVAALRATDADAECWSWWPEGRTAGFWQRRMAQETLVHRWDAELGAGIRGAPMDPAVAADGVDEYLDVFAGLTRMLHTAPAGPSIHVHCTDSDGEWLLRLPAAGERVLTREHAKADVALRGPAEGLLLMMWGRLESAAANVEVIGDTDVVNRWVELFPPM
ncbi:MAG: maleylpyruvate isomerase family mycothiol-dependent enzyme [Actinomycetota bacterium]|nr:maleylpyruvate isomerase family mycothiol-dependent enzyme [Actinomycetota bacterium]